MLGKSGAKADKLKSARKATQFKKGVPKTAEQKAAIAAGHARRRAELAVDDAIREELIDCKKKGVPAFRAFIKGYVKAALANPEGAAGRKIADVIFGEDTIRRLDQSREKEIEKDLDFQRYRIHQNLFDLQREVILEKSKRKMMICGRRSGKTECDAAMIVDAAVRPDSLLLYVGQTVTDAATMIVKKVQRFASLCDLPIAQFDESKGEMTFANQSRLFIRGNNSSKEREKLQGKFYDLIVIDEIQSQPRAKYLVETICEPMLLDRDGSLVLSGSPPRVPNTYAERVWTGDFTGWKKWNWNLSRNPFIKNCETVLDEIKAERNLSDTDAIFQREYLGRFVYDFEAIVFRPTEENWLVSVEGWLEGRNNVRLYGGVDYGYADATAIAILALDAETRELALVYEAKRRKEGAQEIIQMLKDAQSFADALPVNADAKRFYWYADSSNGNITHDLYAIHDFRIQNAYKQDKDWAIDQIRDLVRERRLKFAADGPFADECRQTVFKRDKATDLVVHEIDDNTFHPDMMDALLYASRSALLDMMR